MSSGRSVVVLLEEFDWITDGVDFGIGVGWASPCCRSFMSSPLAFEVKLVHAAAPILPAANAQIRPLDANAPLQFWTRCIRRPHSTSSILTLFSLLPARPS